MSSGADTPEGGGRRTRLLLAGTAATGLAALVAVLVLAASGEEERSFTAAPPECIEGWNADAAALAFGQHQSGSHGYYEVQVLFLTPDGSSVAAAGEPGASCAVVFAASALDPEPVSAAQIQKRGAWAPLSGLASSERLTSLQSEAQSAYNAQVTPQGTIEALEG